MKPTRASARADSSARDGAYPPPPDPLVAECVDTHCHLDIRDGEWMDPAAALTAAAAVGVTRIVQVGCDLPGARWAADVADRFDPIVAVVGLHPNEAPRLAESGELDAALAQIEALLARPRVRGVGETGLDFFRTGPEGRAAQEESFRAHIRLARRHDLALVIHDRDAHDDVLRVLLDEGPPDRVVFHCFSGDAAMARTCVEHGWVLSFAGVVTFKNADGLREALAAVPLESVMVETDAPYLTPAPYRGRPNASYLVPWTVREVARVQGVPEEDVCAAVTATAQRVFGAWG